MSFLSACSGTGMLNALAPSGTTRVASDVPYGSDPRQRLDVYAPAGRDLPVVVFLYGGGWYGGERGMYPFVGASLGAKGVLTVIPDYRVYPQVRFPDFVDDAARAVAWTRAHAAEYGGDPRRIFLIGHSAGAHIAALLTLDKHYLTAVGLDPDKDIAGMAGLAGPYDFLPLTEDIYKAIFAPAAGDMAVTQPISFARGDAPPMLLLAGSADRVVLPRNTVNLAAAIRADGGRVAERIYPGIGHPLVLGAIARPMTWVAPVLSDIVSFLAANGAAVRRVGSAAQASPGVMAGFVPAIGNGAVPGPVPEANSAGATIKSFGAPALAIGPSSPGLSRGPGPARRTNRSPGQARG